MEVIGREDEHIWSLAFQREGLVVVNLLPPNALRSTVHVKHRDGASCASASFRNDGGNVGVVVLPFFSLFFFVVKSEERKFGSEGSRMLSSVNARGILMGLGMLSPAASRRMPRKNNLRREWGKKS